MTQLHLDLIHLLHERDCRHLCREPTPNPASARLAGRPCTGRGGADRRSNPRRGQRARAQVAKERGAAFGWHRLTLSQLAAAIAAPALAARGLIPLSRVGTEAIVAGLVHRLRAEGGLGRYDDVSATPGFPRAVAGVIAELRVARVPSDAVGSVAPDLVPLIGTYEAELAEAGLADWSDVLVLATEAAGPRWPRPAPPDRLPHVVPRRPNWQRSRGRLRSCTRHRSPGGVGHGTHLGRTDA
jgi:hypothetical protein